MASFPFHPKVLTLSKSESPVDSHLHFCVDLSPVHHGLVGPHAEPVAVRQRSRLLEGVEEHDGQNKCQADGPEVFNVQLQLHLE